MQAGQAFNIALALHQAQPGLQFLDTAVEQTLRQRLVIGLSQHVVQGEMGDQQVVHRRLEIVARLRMAQRVAMQFLDRAAEFFADVRQRHAVPMFPGNIGRAVGAQGKITISVS